MVVNSDGAVFPRAFDRSQYVQNRWNPYASGPSGPSSVAGYYGPPYDLSPGAPLNHHAMHHPVHSLVAAADGSQGHGVKFSPTGDGYGGGGSAHGGYDYHPPPPPFPPPSVHHSAPAHSIIHALPPLWPAGSPSGKAGKGKGAALSALTLLAFLYFLNLLQSCLKDHMETMNPTVMVMTAGATRRKDISGGLEQESGSAEDGPRGETGAGPDIDAVERYEGFSKRFQLLTTSNGTVNPFVQVKRMTQSNRKTTPARRKHPPPNTGTDWHGRR